jgi:hypothetical protein
VSAVHWPMSSTRGPFGYAVVPAIAVHIAALVLWGMSGSGTEAGGDAATPRLSVRWVEPASRERSGAAAPSADLASAKAGLAVAPSRTEVVDPRSTPVSPTPSRRSLNTSATTPPSPHASTGAPGDSLATPWASPGELVVRVEPSDLGSGPSQAVLTLSFDDGGSIVDVRSAGSPLPPPFEDAVRSVLRETRFAVEEASDTPSLPSRLRVRVNFESSELAR